MQPFNEYGPLTVL